MQGLIIKDLLEEAGTMSSPVDVRQLNKKFPFLASEEIEATLKENGFKELKVDRRG